MKKLDNTLFGYLACFEKAHNYSTHGRFFTETPTLQKIAHLLNERFLRDDDFYVDMCCGTNEFGAMLKCRGFMGYDICPPTHHNSTDHFRLQSWSVPLRNTADPSASADGATAAPRPLARLPTPLTGTRADHDRHTP